MFEHEDEGVGAAGLQLQQKEPLAGVRVNYTDLEAHPHSAIHLQCDLGQVIDPS